MIKMYTTNWCGDCRVAKRVLDSRGVPYQEIDIENDHLAAEYVMQVNGGKRSVPTLEYAGDAVSMSNFSRARLDIWLEKHGLYAATQNG